MIQALLCLNLNIDDDLFKHIKYADEESTDKNIHFLKRIGFGGDDQEDSNEFLIALIEKYKLESLFNIEFEVKITCVSCRSIVATNKNTDLFYTLKKDTMTKENDEHIESYLKCSIDEIQDYKCEKCLVKGDSIHASYLRKTSNFLIINFIHKLEKIETVLLGKYYLKAAIYHIGNPSYGHYYTKGIRNGKTYMFNDMKIYPSQIDDVEHICMLFYEYKD
jgi:ubiquitin C-terminal hydrolase